MTQFMINMAIGPVQEFIASARKLRDLWLGSYLLSELSKSVARSLQKQGCELIFPAVISQEELFPGSSMNVANKIMALTRQDQNDEPGEIVRTAHNAYRQYWQDICHESLSKAKKILPHNMLLEDLFQKQIDDCGDFFAAWVEYDPKAYCKTRERCEQYLAGRKTLRNFQSPTWKGDGKPKSSLDGIRESVVVHLDHDHPFLKKNEYLDVLGIVKRFYPMTMKRRPFFDNMAQVAALPLIDGLSTLEELQKNELASKLDTINFAEIISKFPDARDLYPNGIPTEVESRHSLKTWPKGISIEYLHPSVISGEKQAFKHTPQEKSWNKLEKLLKQLIRSTAEPMPYACLLVGDGDHMGQCLNALKSKEEHQKFSKQLDKFARQVHDLLDEYKGQVIYSGGDDIMAYVPLHKALKCAEAINAEFIKIMEKAVKNTPIEEPPTFSMGLAVVHHHMPLHLAIETAKKAEKAAKNEGGRNCLAIIQTKRSGNDIKLCSKWKQTHRVLNIVNEFINDNISTRLAYQLRTVAKECGNKMKWGSNKNGQGPEPVNTAAAEALRLTRRKDKQTNINFLYDYEDIRELSDALIIGLQFSRAEEIALAQNFNKNQKETK